jgi:hypothetical protein
MDFGIALEYGGVGPLWELVTDKDILREQIPRLHDLIKARDWESILPIETL